MDIVVKGRNVEVPEHYREHVAEKLARVERYDRKTIRADVELNHERNPRQAKNCQRVEITVKGRGGAVRAEACAGDFYSALDSATTKLENRLRRMHDRRKVHYGKRNPISVAQATSANAEQTVASANSGGVGLLEQAPESAVSAGSGQEQDAADAPTAGDPGTDAGSSTAPDRAGTVPEPRWSAETREDEPGRIVREKEHPATPMTVDQALYQMELVGHDFYMFFDADTGRPSVVYRRRGFDYGVIRLAC